MNKMSIDRIDSLLKSGKVALYGYLGSRLPLVLTEKTDKKLKIFFKDGSQKNILKTQNIKYNYSGYKDTPWDVWDVVILSQSAVKALCIGFPTKSKYILVSLQQPRFYVFIVIGLIRRIFGRSIKVLGIKCLDQRSHKGIYLVLECKAVPTNSFKFSEEIGITGLLKFLRDQDIRYIIPRFYSGLHDLQHTDGDLDLLVHADDVKRLNSFLSGNPGKLDVDVYCDFGNDYHGMSYFPPHHARKSIETSSFGPGNIKIPSDDYALPLLVYHILYHKGYASLLPSIFTNQVLVKGNKYHKELSRLGVQEVIGQNYSLEELDSYMDRIGWKPRNDTLSKISDWNAWVRDMLEINLVGSSVPLYAIVMKSGCKTLSKENIIKDLLVEKGYSIIFEGELLGEKRTDATEKIRGGVWNDSLVPGENYDMFLPYKLLIIYDDVSSDLNRITSTKNYIRKKIDVGKPSLIHSSDNYEETLEYIEICFSERYDYVKDIVQKKNKSNESKRIKIDYDNLISGMKIRVRNFLINILKH